MPDPDGTRGQLTPAEDGRPEFEMRGGFTGPLPGLTWRSMPDLAPSFEQFLAALGVRVEQATRDA